MSEPLKPCTYNQALADAEETVIPYLPQENVKVGLNSYNDGLEAAAKWHDDKARVFRSVTGFGGEIDAHNHGCYARAIRALKQEEAPATSDPRDALIKELMGALQLVDDDVRHHLRSDKIYHSLLRAHAVEAVRNALSKAKGVVDGS